MFLNLLAVWTMLGYAGLMMAAGDVQNRIPRERSGTNRTARSPDCLPFEYSNNGLCCMNCPPGTHVSKHCTEDHGRGFCSPCTPGKDFTAGSNGMEACLKCHPCRFDDQVQVSECRADRDYQCQCKEKTFCTNMCHLYCKDCTRCPEGQYVKNECTPTSDTVCDVIGSIHPPTTKQGLDDVLAVALPVSIVIVIILGFVFSFFYWKKKQKDKKNQTVDYQSPPFQDSPESVQIMPVMAPPDPERLDNLRSQGSSTPLGQQDRETFFQVGKGDQCSVTEADCEGEEPRGTSPADPTDTHLPDLEAGTRVCHRMEPRSEPTLSDEEWFECYNCLKENVLPQHWKEMMRRLGLSEADIQSSYPTPCHFGETSYQMFLSWRNQNGRNASMSKVLHVLDKMKLRGCKENVANGLMCKGIQVLPCSLPQGMAPQET